MHRKIIVGLTFALLLFAVTGCSSAKSGSSASSTSFADATPTGKGGTFPSATAANAQIPVVVVKVASGRHLTRTQWIAKSDAICTRLNTQLEAITVRKAWELPRVLPQEAALVRTEVSELAKLVPPASKTSAWQDFLTESLQWAEGSDKLVAYRNLGDEITKSPLAVNILAIRKHLTMIARQDGLIACALA
jgi:hypothetical protein